MAKRSAPPQRLVALAGIFAHVTGAFTLTWKFAGEPLPNTKSHACSRMGCNLNSPQKSAGGRDMRLLLTLSLTSAIGLAPTGPLRAERLNVPGLIGAFMGMAIQNEQQQQRQQQLYQQQGQSPAISPEQETYMAANEAFDRLPLGVRYDEQMLLGVAGYSAAVSSADFSHRLFDAICRFQQDVGYQPTGVLLPEQNSKLHQIADPLLAEWNLSPLRDGTTGIPLWVPRPAGSTQVRTNNGENVTTQDGALKVHYKYLKGARLDTTYKYLVHFNEKRFKVRFKTLRPDFLVVAAGNGQTENYTRYQHVRGGLLGFTLFWNTASSAHGERLATIMSDLFRAASTGEPNRHPPEIAPEYQAVAAEQQRAAEQQAEQQKQQAAEKAAAAEAEKKQGQLTRVIPAAKELIQEASEFVAKNPSNPKLLQFVREIATLNAAVSAADPDQIGKLTASLSTELQAEPQFQQLLTEHEKEKREKAARHLADAIQLAGNQVRFITKYVSQNPTAAPTLSLMKLLGDLTTDLKSPSLDVLKPVTEQADLAIGEAGLRKAYEADVSAAVATASSSSPTSSKPGEAVSPAAAPAVSSASNGAAPTGSGLPETAKNSFLIKGDLGDFLVLYNVSPKAPHVVKNLRGDIVFDNSRAQACFFQDGAPSMGDDDALGQALKPYHIGTLNVAPAGCDPRNLLSYDLIAVRRGTFLRQKQEYALALIKTVEDDQYVSLVTVGTKQIEDAENDQEAASKAIENDVEHGAKLGFGFVLVNNGSATICAVVPNEIDGHRLFILSSSDQLARELHNAPTMTQMSLDTAYIGIKRHQCGALYASAGDLKTILAGLTRDQIPYRMSVAWASPADIDEADAAALKAKQTEDEQTLAKQRKADDDRKLAVLKARDEAATQAKQQQALQSQYGNIANSLSAAISREVSDYVDHPAKDEPALAGQFPQFVSWYASAENDRWELQSFNSSLFDYGLSDWKGRKLDTAFSQVKLRMKNRVLGDYKDVCYIFGRIIDSEFQMTRDPFEAKCDDTASIKSWQRAHGFQSRWLVN